MRNLQRGFVVPLFLGLFAALLVAAYVFTEPTKQNQTTQFISAESVPAVNLPVAKDTTEPHIIPAPPKPSASPAIVVSPTPAKPAPATVPAPSKNQISTVTACTDIHTPGTYTLDRDIVSPEGKSCIKIHDTTDVQVDCAGHTISSDIGLNSISIDRVKGFAVRSCLFKNKTAAPIKDAFSDALMISESQDGSITKNTFSSSTFESIQKSSNVTISDNTVRGQFLVNASRNVVIQNNAFVFTPTGKQTGAGTQLNLTNGSNNIVSGNTFDGGSNGIFNPVTDDNVGADDSITMSDESNDVFQNNDIRNVWDCAIENNGFFFDSKILNNRIKNAGIAGICGWYYSSIRGDAFDGNVVDDSPEIFHFFRLYGIKNKNSTTVYFKDNTFSNNRFLTQRGDHMASWFVIDVPSDNSGGIRPVTKADIVVGNNTFTNNDFGTMHAPHFYPNEMIVDGGRNQCVQPTDTSYPLKCTP